MTGFATAEQIAAPFRLVWEIRGVNHRFLELTVRLPDELRSLEAECRERVGALVKRGKVDCTLRVAASDGGAPRGALVPDALRALKNLERAVLDEFPTAAALSVSEVLRWPGVVQEPTEQIASLATAARQSLAAALAAFVDSRRREGLRIAEYLAQRAASITHLIDAVRPLLAGAQVRYRDKLLERLARLGVQADPVRLEQELALIAQRFDISEEVERLAGHVAEVHDTLAREEPIGRRLDFLMQELNREANTFASKVQEEALTRTAVELKVVIEQMREQVQNLE